jgi:hypothetical protein
MAMTSTEEEMVKEGILAVVVCAWKVSTRNPFVEGMRMLVGEVVRDFVAMARAWRGHRQATSCLSSGDLRVSVQQGPPSFLRLCLEVLAVLDELSPGNTRLRSVTTKLLWLARLDKLDPAEERREGFQWAKAPELLCVLQACFGGAADDTYLST